MYDEEMELGMEATFSHVDCDGMYHQTNVVYKDNDVIYDAVLKTIRGMVGMGWSSEQLEVYIEEFGLDNSSEHKMRTLDDILLDNTLFFKKLDDDAIIPEYKTSGSSGFDLHIIEDVEIYMNETKILKTGLACELPPSTEMQIRPRSGLSAKSTVILPNSPGTIDNDYRGEIGIIMRNIGDEPIKFKKGDRVAQGVVVKVNQYNIDTILTLSETDRGDGGYGSTGSN